MPIYCACEVIVTPYSRGGDTNEYEYNVLAANPTLCGLKDALGVVFNIDVQDCPCESECSLEKAIIARTKQTKRFKNKVPTVYDQVDDHVCGFQIFHGDDDPEPSESIYVLNLKGQMDPDVPHYYSELIIASSGTDLIKQFKEALLEYAEEEAEQQINRDDWISDLSEQELLRACTQFSEFPYTSLVLHVF